MNVIDLSEVGLVEYEWYFDEDEYAEWLQDSEVTDSEEVRNQYYTERRGHGRDYPSIKKPYSHSSSSEPKPKNQDIDKKGDQSSKITSAPKNNKTEPVKDQNEKDLEAPKPEEEAKPVNGSV